MSTPAELRHELYRQLYFAERSRREQIRSGIAVPVSAIAFSVFAFSALATNVDLAKWQAASTLLLMLLALGAAASVLAAILSLVRVEWLLVFDEPPDLTELLRAEQALASAAHGSDPDAARHLLEAQFRDLLTGGYYIAYRRVFMSNGASSAYRAWAVRLVVLGLFLLLLAYMVLPVHMAV